METRLTETQLGQVVAELSRLAQQRQDLQRQGLDREQIIQVLKELDLPVDLLDDAMEQLRRHEAEAKQRRRRTLLIIAGIAVVILIISGILLFTSHRTAVLGRVAADQPRITRTVDDGGTLNKVVRDGQDVVFHVLLHDAPVGEKLSLSGRWIDPNGRVFHENRWDTKIIDSSSWRTSLRCQIGSAAPAGAWTVEISLDGRVLTKETFQVE